MTWKFNYLALQWDVSRKDIAFSSESVAGLIMHQKRMLSSHILLSPYVYFYSLELASVGQCWDVSHDIKGHSLPVPCPHCTVSQSHLGLVPWTEWQVFCAFLPHRQTYLMCNGLFNYCFALVNCRCGGFVSFAELWNTCWFLWTGGLETDCFFLLVLKHI